MAAPLTALAPSLPSTATATPGTAASVADTGADGTGSFRSALDRGLSRHADKTATDASQPQDGTAGAAAVANGKAGKPGNGKPVDVARETRGVDLARLITEAVGATARGLQRDAKDTTTGKAIDAEKDPLTVEDATTVDAGAAALALPVAVPTTPVDVATPVETADSAAVAGVTTVTDAGDAVPVEVQIVADTATSGTEADTPVTFALPAGTVATSGDVAPDTATTGVPNATQGAASATPATQAPTTASARPEAAPVEPDAAPRTLRADALHSAAQVQHASPQASARAEAVAAAPSAVARSDTPPPDVLASAVAPLAASNVAAHLPQATLAPATMQGRIDAPFGTPAWGQSMEQHVSWMLKGAHQTAELQLHPADLGPVQVVLSVENKTAELQFIAREPAVREALQNELPRLRDMLAESGIQLGQASVSAEQQPRDDTAQAAANAGRNRSERGAEPVVPVAPRPVTTHRGLIDTFA